MQAQQWRSCINNNVRIGWTKTEKWSLLTRTVYYDHNHRSKERCIFFLQRHRVHICVDPRSAASIISFQCIARANLFIYIHSPFFLLFSFFRPLWRVAHATQRASLHAWTNCSRRCMLEGFVVERIEFSSRFDTSFNFLFSSSCVSLVVLLLASLGGNKYARSTPWTETGCNCLRAAAVDRKMEAYLWMSLSGTCFIIL